MVIHQILLGLAFVGVAVCAYLMYERNRKRPPVCVIGQSCATVWESPYSKIFGIGNEVFGMVFYLAVAGIEYALLNGIAPLPVFAGEMVVIAIGFFMSCYYVYLEWRIIQAWCFWCTLSAVIVWTMAFIRVAFGA